MNSKAVLGLSLTTFETCLGYRVGYLCTTRWSPATALKTKEYIEVIDLDGGSDWERFSMLPSDPHAPSSTTMWNRFGALLVTIFV